MSAPLLAYDREVRREGVAILCGVDEVGRGPLAGPVVAAAVVLGPDASLDGLDDSKKLSIKERERLEELILNGALFVGVGVVSVEEIDRTDILAASLRAMALAVASLGTLPDLVLVDGNRRVPDLPHPQRTVVKGDSLSASIAAASIIAKVHRDRIMDELSRLHPGYGFELHAGYGTRAHLEALRVLGPSPVHRRTFKGVRELIPGTPRPGFLFEP